MPLACPLARAPLSPPPPLKLMRRPRLGPALAAGAQLASWGAAALFLAAAAWPLGLGGGGAPRTLALALGVSDALAL